MRTALSILLIIFSIMDIYSQNRLTDRQPVAAGRFYSAGRESLTNDIKGLFAGCKKTLDDLKVRAMICPHAGYVFFRKGCRISFFNYKGEYGFQKYFFNRIQPCYGI